MLLPPTQFHPKTPKPHVSHNIENALIYLNTVYDCIMFREICPLVILMASDINKKCSFRQRTCHRWCVSLLLPRGSSGCICRKLPSGPHHSTCACSRLYRSFLE